MTGALKSVPVLILSPHSRCNCRCAMCDIWKDTSSGEIAIGNLERQIDSIDAFGVEWVVLSGGEPLMHPDLFRICGVLRSRPRRITLLSSGLLLQRYAHEIVTHIDDVVVSLDGPAHIHDRIRGIAGAFDLLRRGIQAIRGCKPAYPMGARCTVQRLNCASLVETAAAARELGLDSVSFLAADVASAAFNRPVPWNASRQSSIALDEAGIARLERQIETLLPEAGAFVRESPAKLRRIAHHFRAQLGLTDPVAPVCNAPWVSMVLEADGTVRPCFFHEAIGKLDGSTTLEQVWNGPRAIAFREGLNIAQNPICRRCVCSLNRKT